MSWLDWAVVLLGFVMHGRAVRKLTVRVTKLEGDMPLPDKHYAPDIDDRGDIAPIGPRE